MPGFALACVIRSATERNFGILRHHQQIGKNADQRDRRKIADRVVVDRWEQVAIDRQPAGSDQHGVAVRRRARDEFHRDVAAGAWLVLDHDLLAPDFREPRAEDATDGVDAAAGCERYDQTDVASGPGLRICASAESGSQRGCCGKAREAAAVEHGVQS